MPTHEGRSTRQIEREIDGIRADIEYKAERIQNCFSPSALMDRAMDRLHTADARSFFVNVGRDVRDNPLPAVLTGIGLVWLMAGSRRGERDIARSSERSSDGSSGRLEATGRRARKAARRARNGAASVASRAREGLQRGQHGLAEAGRRLKHGADEGAQRVRRNWERLSEEQPLLLGVLGLAAGALAGGSLPRTEVEDEWLGDVRDDVARQFVRRGREQVERVREGVSSLGGDDDDSSDDDEGGSSYGSSSSASYPESSRHEESGGGSSYRPTGGGRPGHQDGGSGRNGGGSR